MYVYIYNVRETETDRQRILLRAQRIEKKEGEEGGGSGKQDD